MTPVKRKGAEILTETPEKEEEDSGKWQKVQWHRADQQVVQAAMEKTRARLVPGAHRDLFLRNGQASQEHRGTPTQKQTPKSTVIPSTPTPKPTPRPTPKRSSKVTEGAGRRPKKISKAAKATEEAPVTTPSVPLASTWQSDSSTSPRGKWNFRFYLTWHQVSKTIPPSNRRTVTHQ